MIVHLSALLLVWAPMLGERGPLLVRPLPVWDYWWLLLLPLCAAIAIVYKSIKCQSMHQVPREATSITLWILAGMVIAASVLLVLVNVVSG